MMHMQSYRTVISILLSYNYWEKIIELIEPPNQMKGYDLNHMYEQYRCLTDEIKKNWIPRDFNTWTPVLLFNEAVHKNEILTRIMSKAKG